MTKGTSTVYSFCGPTVIDGKAIRNMVGTTFKTHPYPTRLHRGVDVGPSC